MASIRTIWCDRHLTALQEQVGDAYAQGQAARQAASSVVIASEPHTPQKAIAKLDVPGDSPGRASAESMTSYALREIE